MTAPLISVILPVYNVSGYVAAAIDSLRAQTLQDFEVLVIDDGSTDDSARQAVGAISDDPRFEMIRQANRGLSGARNAGLDRARGRFIAFLDSDDRVMPDYLDRLWQALEETGADWVACAVRSCFPDGTGQTHSAIHGAASLALHPVRRCYRFETCHDVIRHFPSAWNKLYRRSLIGDLRFEEGIWFEDHEFFHRVAARTDHLLHLPEALYLQTRGRQGQITGADDDRVFEQFDVLRRLRQHFAASGRPGAEQAFAELASRLLFERSTALTQPERRMRFAEASAAFLSDRGLRYTPDWDPDIARSWELEMAGETPLSVVIPWDGQDPDLLTASLAALTAQPGPGREVLVICDSTAQATAAQALLDRYPLNGRTLQQPHRGVGAARNHGLAEARGVCITFLDAGDLPDSIAYPEWVETLLRTEADMVISGFTTGTGDGAPPHNGFHDMRALPHGTPPTGPVTLSAQGALALVPHLPAKLFRRSFLIDTGLRCTSTRRSEWALVLGAALLGRLAYVNTARLAIDDSPAAQRLLRRPDTPWSLWRAQSALIHALPAVACARLPAGWQRRLYGRAIWLAANPGQPRRRAGLLILLAGAMLIALMRRLTGARVDQAGFDPSFGPRLALVLHPLGMLGGPRLLPHGPPQAAPANPLPPDLMPEPQETAEDLPIEPPAPPGKPECLFFPLKGRGVLRFRADFNTGPFANISFVAGDRIAMPFHLSLRFDSQIAVCNDKRIDGVWRAERLHAVHLSKSGVVGEIRIEPPHVTVRLEGTEIFRFGPRRPWRRHGFTALDTIRFVETEGRIRIMDRMPQSPNQDLGLDPLLQVRADRPAAGHRLHLEPGGRDLPLIPATDGGLLAQLPARIWQDLPDTGTLTLRLTEVDGAPAGRPLTLDRDTLAARIDDILACGPDPADCTLALRLLEHVHHGALQSRLSSGALDRAHRLARFHGLSGYLDPATPGSALPPGSPADLVADLAADPAETEANLALAQITRVLRDTPEADSLDHLALLALPPNARRAVFLGLAELFCCDGHDMAGLHALARKQGALPLEPGDDAWSRSACLPYLFLEGHVDTVIDTLRQLLPVAQGWIQTPAIAWVIRQAVTAPSVSDRQRDLLCRLFTRFIDLRASDYWERTACRELTATAAYLLCHHGHDDAMAEHIRSHCLKSYGLSRLFWDRVDREQAGMTGQIDPVTRFARDAFATLRDPDTPAPDLQAAVAVLERMGCAGAARYRHDLFGPAGVPLPQGHPPDPTALQAAPGDIGEGALRYLAHPGMVPAPALVPAETTAEAGRALRKLYRYPAPARHGDIQARLAGALRPLLAVLPDRHPADAELETLLGDLSRLAHAGSDFLGIGLALDLLARLGDQSAGTDTATRVAEWICTHVSQTTGTDRDALREAAALRRGCTALRDSASPHAGALLALIDPSDLPEQAQLSPDLATGDPLFDTVVCVFSCRAYLDSRIPALRAGWLRSLERLGIPWLIIVGDGDGSRLDDIVFLDAPDDYEGLPQKTLAAIAWIHEHTAYGHMVKIDDDCFLDADLYFSSLNHLRADYYGRKLTRAAGQTDRTWHQAKSGSARGRLELDKSPEPSVYADGGSGYALSRHAMAMALDAAASPEGRQLIQMSFMEDKLLGDLLAMRGIWVSDTGYAVSIRRCARPGGLPVPFWVNSFFPGQAAPVHLVHLDRTEDQPRAQERLTSPDLWPKKLWPSYQRPLLGHGTNALELISPERRCSAIREAPVAVIACMRNEMFMLPHFLDHYRKLGVEAFAIADNGSDDGTLEYLAEEQDVTLFSVDTDYRHSHYGVAWQQALMAAFRRGKWSVIADADEFLVWQHNQTQTLPGLLRSSDFDEAEAVRVFMLDMYPEGPLEAADFARGGPFAGAGCCDAVPFLRQVPARGPFSDQPFWTSALRHRLIPGSRPNLFVAQKLALLRYQPWIRLSAGLHFIGDARLARRELIFAHFKYNADFRRKAVAEVARGQHFNNAEEYRKYLALAAEGRSTIHDPDLSVPWTQSPFVATRLRP